MSAQQDSRYVVLAMPGHYHGTPYALVSTDKHQPTPTDLFRSEAAAHHAANMLNRGIARVDPHAVLGCKVVQS